MKRDMDLVRRILKKVEEDDVPEDGDPSVVWIDFEDVDYGIINRHLRLLAEAGLLRTTLDPTDNAVGELTWDGHEFLDAIRDDQIWSKVKRQVSDQLVSAPATVLKALALMLIKDTLGIPGS